MPLGVSFRENTSNQKKSSYNAAAAGAGGATSSSSVKQQQIAAATSLPDFDALNHSTATTNLEMSGSRLYLPTLATSGRFKKGEDTGIPAELEELQHLTPRQRIRKEFKLKREATHHQRPSCLFGKEYDREQEKRRSTSQDNGGFKSVQHQKKSQAEDERQNLRLARSQLAVSQSMAIEKGTVEKVATLDEKRASAWAKKTENRHMYQVSNWNDANLHGGTNLPTVPDRWQPPGPGSYGGSVSFMKPKWDLK